MAQWYRSVTGREFHKWYGIALGDMEDDGLSVLVSIEKREVLFIPRDAVHYSREPELIAAYEAKVNAHLGRSDIRWIVFKKYEVSDGQAKVIDPFTGAIGAEKTRTETLREFMDAGGLVCYAEDAQLDSLFFKDNKVIRSELHVLPGEFP